MLGLALLGAWLMPSYDLRAALMSDEQREEVAQQDAVEEAEVEVQAVEDELADVLRDADEELEAALGVALYGGRYEPSELAFRVEAVAHSFPDHVPSQLASATLAYRSGEKAKTQFYLERVVALDPGHPEAISLRARVAIDDGNLVIARRRLLDAWRTLREFLADIGVLSGEPPAGGMDGDGPDPGPLELPTVGQLQASL